MVLRFYPKGNLSKDSSYLYSRIRQGFLLIANPLSGAMVLN